MGSYDYTCALSDLPIHCGEKIRYMLISSSPYDEGSCSMVDSWFPRTFPIRAEYNDYGSVQNVQEGLVQDLWMEGFKKDLISVGTGENTCHDLPTSKDMTFEEMLESLDRLLVDSNVGEQERKEFDKKFNKLTNKRTPKGVPTMQRIKKILVKNSFVSLRRGYEKSGYLIDKIRYGEIRIRWTSSGPDYGKDVEKLSLIQPFLNKKYVTALKAGKGLDHAELMVFVRPGTKDFHGSIKDKNKPLKINHMMIREDVWQKLLALPVEGYDPNYKRINITIQDHKNSIYDLYLKCQEVLPNSDLNLNFYNLDFQLERKYNKEDLKLASNIAPWVGKSQVPFTIGLSEHWQMLCQKRLPLKQVKSILDDIAEFIHIWKFTKSLRWYWRPSKSTGPQYGEWEQHQKFLKLLLEVTNEQLKEQDQELE